MRTCNLTFAVSLLFHSPPSILFALDDLYDAPGCDRWLRTVTSMPDEHIDPFTGGLTLSHVDARLPGNGGLDLVIQRVFNSKDMCSVHSDYGCSLVGERTWMGYDWRLHFGRLYVVPNAFRPFNGTAPERDSVYCRTFRAIEILTPLLAPETFVTAQFTAVAFMHALGVHSYLRDTAL